MPASGSYAAGCAADLRRVGKARQSNSAFLPNALYDPVKLHYMLTPTRFEKEQALRQAGILLTPYPTVGPDTNRATQTQSDWALLDAGTAWEEEIDRLYADMLADRDSGQDKI
jgi:hypothetical protein